MKNHIIIPLREILACEEYEISKIEEAFSRFRCEKEEDLQDFLVKNAVVYDQKGIGKTFLFLNEEELMGEKHSIVIDAYVTLATKGLDISALSKSKKKKVFGSYPGVDNLNSISVF